MAVTNKACETKKFEAEPVHFIRNAHFPKFTLFVGKKVVIKSNIVYLFRPSKKIPVYPETQPYLDKKNRPCFFWGKKKCSQPTPPNFLKTLPETKILFYLALSCNVQQILIFC
jgi:hypothetical protein